MHKLKAFTLLELLVVMVVLSLIVYVVLPYTIRDLRSNTLKATVNEISSNIMAVQQDAFTGRNSKSYGIVFYSNRYTVYTGSSLAAADSSEDIYVANGKYISSIVLTGGAIEINFPLGSLKPSVNGYINVSDDLGTYRISINAQGLIEVTKL